MATQNSWNNQVISANILFNGGTFTVGSDNAANAISIGTGTTARTIGIGNSAAAHTCTFGSSNTTATTTIQAGSGRINLTGGITVTGFAEGALVTSNTGAVSTVTGTAGYVFTANAAGTAPSFQAPLNTQTITAVNAAASPYTVLSTDQYLSVDASGGAVTIRLPNTTTTGRIVYVKDKGGNAATNNITLTTPGGAVTIDGATSFAMNTAYESVSVIWNGSSYEIF